MLKSTKKKSITKFEISIFQKLDLKKTLNNIIVNKIIKVSEPTNIHKMKKKKIE